MNSYNDPIVHAMAWIVSVPALFSMVRILSQVPERLHYLTYVWFIMWITSGTSAFLYYRASNGLDNLVMGLWLLSMLASLVVAEINTPNSVTKTLFAIVSFSLGVAVAIMFGYVNIASALCMIPLCGWLLVQLFYSFKKK